MPIATPFAYLSPMYIVNKHKHRHYFLLALRAGRVVAVCEGCGAMLDAVQIENVLNMQDVE